MISFDVPEQWFATCGSPADVKLQLPASSDRLGLFEHAESCRFAKPGEPQLEITVLECKLCDTQYSRAMIHLELGTSMKE